MDSPSASLSATVEQPKRPGFFRLLARNAGNNKQGLAVVMLAASCFFLSMSMLDSKRRLQQLQDHYLSLKSENEQLKLTLDSVSNIVFEDAQLPPPPPQPSTSTGSPAAPQAGEKGFMI